MCKYSPCYVTKLRPLIKKYLVVFILSTCDIHKRYWHPVKIPQLYSVNLVQVLWATVNDTLVPRYSVHDFHYTHTYHFSSSTHRPQIQCLKVDCVWSSLHIHPEFDEIMRLCGWNKFWGLHVDHILAHLHVHVHSQWRKLVTHLSRYSGKPSPHLLNPMRKFQWMTMHSFLWRRCANLYSTRVVVVSYWLLFYYNNLYASKCTENGSIQRMPPGA